jgi:hypothetical protein
MTRHFRLIFVIWALSLSLFASDNPFSGTWKLNLAKSKLPPPAPQSDIAKVAVDNNSVKLDEEITDDKGQRLKISFEAKFDGKDYPVTGDPGSDSVSYQRVSANTLRSTSKKSGKVTTKAKILVSDDGKVTTVHFTDYSQAKPFHGMGVYDKQ